MEESTCPSLYRRRGGGRGPCMFKKCVIGWAVKREHLHSSPLTHHFPWPWLTADSHIWFWVYFLPFVPAVTLSGLHCVFNHSPLFTLSSLIVPPRHACEAPEINKKIAALGSSRRELFASFFFLLLLLNIWVTYRTVIKLKFQDVKCIRLFSLEVFKCNKWIFDTFGKLKTWCSLKQCARKIKQRLIKVFSCFLVQIPTFLNRFYGLLI